jgi:predicted tellurium resistance membrane protein TerC
MKALLTEEIPPNKFVKGLAYGFILALVFWAALIGLALFLVPK